MTKSFDEYQSAGDSISLKEIGEKPFTIVGVEDSDYEEGKTKTPGVKIQTKETFEKKDGEEVNKIHTTRTAIVSKLYSVDAEGKPANQKILGDLAKGEEIGPVKCVLVKAKKGGKDYYDLVAAD